MQGFHLFPLPLLCLAAVVGALCETSREPWLVTHLANARATSFSFSRHGRYSVGQLMRLAARLPACAVYIKSIQASLKGPAASFRPAMFIGYWQVDCT